LSWLIAFLGFAALIILHELGHFTVAKAVGMRVERFSLFFPPFIWRRQGKGDTEYTIGSIPLGGYVKISGMSPHEELPPGTENRAYMRQPVWKRIAVIVAGPAVNIVIAFVILTGIVLHNGVPADGATVATVQRGEPAEGYLRPGDRILSVDGVTGDIQRLSRQIGSHRCPGTPTAGCRAESPVTLVVDRDGQRITERIRPAYDAKLRRMRLGYTQQAVFESASVPQAAGRSVSEMWRFTTGTVSTIAQIFNPAKRNEISGVVGSYEVTRQAVQYDAQTALYVLAVISLSLGVINLFPFLPLDGGHIFWALAEKVRGRAIPFSVMERAGFVGFALVMLLFVVGLTNDIGRLAGEGFNLQR
jgi:regulator of sigma E protease